MVMNISCKFEKASYNFFFVRAATVKSLYTLQRRKEVKSIASIIIGISTQSSEFYI